MIMHMQRRSYASVMNSLKSVAPYVNINVQEIDQKPLLLCTPSATYDLRYGLFGKEESDPANLITRITAVDPFHNGEDIWNAFLNQVFDNDSSLIEYVQNICGLVAIGKVYVESLIISYGDGGNGKSTFWNTIAKVLGSYYGMISADTLTTDCRRNVMPEIAEIRGCRLVIASESQEGARLNDGMVKKLCSTDALDAEKKYKDHFKFVPTHTLVLYTNHLPRIGATDDGIWRRIIVLPFNHKFTNNSDEIKNYSDELFEKAGGAVLSWIIEGERKIYERKFKLPTPKIVTDAIAQYKIENDWFQKFFDERCLSDAKGIINSGELYQAYRGFAVERGEHIRKQCDFNAELKKRGFEQVDIVDKFNNRKRVFKGLTLIEDEVLDFLK